MDSLGLILCLSALKPNHSAREPHKIEWQRQYLISCKLKSGQLRRIRVTLRKHKAGYYTMKFLRNTVRLRVDERRFYAGLLFGAMKMLDLLGYEYKPETVQIEPYELVIA